MKRIRPYLKSLKGSAAPVPPLKLAFYLSVSLLLSVLALYVQYLLKDLIRPSSFVLLYPLVFLTSLLWGAVPGVVSWLAAILGANYFLLEPVGSIFVISTGEVVGLILFAILGLGIIFSNHYSLQLKMALRQAFDDKLYVEEQKRRSEGVLQKLSELDLLGIIYFDFDGRIIDANPAFLRLLGFSKEDLADGKVNWKSITPEGWENADQQAIEQLRERSSFDPFEKEYLSKSGERVPVLVGGGLYAEESRQGTAFVFDLRQLKQVEKLRNELQLLIEKSREFVALCDVEGRILYLNEFAKRIISPPSSETLRSLRLLDLLRPYDFGDAKSDLLSSKTLDREFELEAFMTSPFNNSIVPMRIQSFPIYENEGSEVARYAFLGRDLSNEVESADRLKTALDVAQMAIWEYDIESHEYFRSGEHDRLYGFEHNLPEWTNDLFYSLIHPADEEKVRRYFRDLIKGQRLDFHITYRIKLSDGEVRWLSARGNVVRDERKRAKRLVGGIVDVSRLKRVEADLKKALRIRDQFISIASHELKTPITSLQLQLELLGHYLSDIQSNRDFDLKEVSATLQESRSQFKHLTNLVNDLLDVTRIANGKLMLTYEDIEIGALIDKAARVLDGADRIQVQGASEKVSFEADRERMMQVIFNLLTNAVKFGRSSPVNVRYGSSTEQNQVWIEVEDHGIGISEEDLEFIFDRFGQGSSGKEKKGLGLGLYITKEIVRAHGGEISVQSQLHKGSIFRIVLPQRRA